MRDLYLIYLYNLRLYLRNLPSMFPQLIHNFIVISRRTIRSSIAKLKRQLHVLIACKHIIISAYGYWVLALTVSKLLFHDRWYVSKLTLIGSVIIIVGRVACHGVSLKFQVIQVIWGLRLTLKINVISRWDLLFAAWLIYSSVEWLVLFHGAMSNHLVAFIILIWHYIRPLHLNRVYRVGYIVFSHALFQAALSIFKSLVLDVHSFLLIESIVYLLQSINIRLLSVLIKVTGFIWALLIIHHRSKF